MHAGPRMPPKRTESRQGDPVRRGQFPFQNLPLDFQADQEEEHRHEAVVDPEQQGLVDGGLTDADSHSRIEQQFIRRRQWRVGGDHGEHRGEYQEQSAGGFEADEVLDRCGQPRIGVFASHDSSGFCNGLDQLFPSGGRVDAARQHLNPREWKRR